MTKEDILKQLSDRHFSTIHIMGYFAYSHLPIHLQSYSRECARLALEMCITLYDGPELTVGLRKLLEAKDCFVRAALDTE